jgi:hypothetical protein
LRAALACALLCAGCGPSAEDYPFIRDAGCERPCEPDAGPLTPPDAGPPVIPDEPLEPWDETGAGPLTGLFAVEVIIPAEAVVELETRQIYRLRILQQGQNVRMRISPCRFSLPSIPSAATLIIPPRLEAVLGTIAIENEGPFLSAADPIGAMIATPEVVVVLGADLNDPANDLLPTMEMPGSAIDQDDDGNPGVTIDADTVLCRNPPEQLYLALRARVTMTATIDDVDRFTGSVTPGLEQSVLGISDRCLSVASDIPITLLEGSSFTALRVGESEDLDGNGNVSCPELSYYAAPLFGEYWF